MMKMNVQVIFCLTLALLFSGGHMVTVTITNNCEYTIWPGTLANDKFPQLEETGFELASKATKSLNIPARWEGRFWARTRCSNNNGRFSCETADCGTGQVPCNGKSGAQPASLAEMMFDSRDDGQDYYNLSLVDGYNVGLAVAPQGGTGTKCSRLGCSGVNGVCPADLQVKGSDGSVIACKSACAAYNKPEYCCTGAYEQTCPPTDYSRIFKKQCPDAYSYAKDDQTSVFSCYRGPNYAITFCP